VTARELQKVGANAAHDTQLVQGLEAQARLRGMIADAEGETLVAKIHRRKRLADELDRADAAYTAAVQAAVGRPGDWASVQVAGERVRECRAALKAVA
jgi:hypothetical protein